MRLNHVTYEHGPGTYTRLDWKDVGIENEHVLRDVWKQQDLGTYSGFFEIEVKPHGVALYKLKY